MTALDKSSLWQVLHFMNACCSLIDGELHDDFDNQTTHSSALAIQTPANCLTMKDQLVSVSSHPHPLFETKQRYARGCSLRICVSQAGLVPANDLSLSTRLVSSSGSFE